MENRRNIVPVAEIVTVIKESVAIGKPVEMTVTGRSMMPLLKDRISSVRLVEPDNLQIGDIVLFERSDGHYVLHRIIGIHDDCYDIVGDNQAIPDTNIPRESIIAKVVAYSRDGKHWKKDDKLYRIFLPAVKTLRLFLSRIKHKVRSK